jgi:hypothetical protein
MLAVAQMTAPIARLADEGRDGVKRGDGRPSHLVAFSTMGMLG